MQHLAGNTTQRLDYLMLYYHQCLLDNTDALAAEASYLPLLALSMAHLLHAVLSFLRAIATSVRDVLIGLELGQVLFVLVGKMLMV